jgi:hypothetical protein
MTDMLLILTNRFGRLITGIGATGITQTFEALDDVAGITNTHGFVLLDRTGSVARTGHPEARIDRVVFL